MSKHGFGIVTNIAKMLQSHFDYALATRALPSPSALEFQQKLSEEIFNRNREIFASVQQQNTKSLQIIGAKSSLELHEPHHKTAKSLIDSLHTQKRQTLYNLVLSMLPRNESSIEFAKDNDALYKEQLEYLTNDLTTIFPHPESEQKIDYINADTTPDKILENAGKFSIASMSSQLLTKGISNILKPYVENRNKAENMANSHSIREEFLRETIAKYAPLFICEEIEKEHGSEALAQARSKYQESINAACRGTAANIERLAWGYSRILPPLSSVSSPIVVAVGKSGIEDPSKDR